MTQPVNKRLLRISAFASLALLLLVAAMVVLPSFLNLDPIKKGVLAGIEQKLRCRVSMASLDFHLFPRPRVIIRDGKMSWPEKLEGSFRSAQIDVHLIPLFLGKVRIQKLHIFSPDFRLGITELPGPVPSDSETQQKPSPEVMLSSLSSVIPAEMTGITVLVTDGSLAVSRNRLPPVQVLGIDATLSVAGATVDLEGRAWSNLSDYLSARLKLDLRGFKGEGRIALTRFRPDVLADSWYPDMRDLLGDSRFHLTVDFQAESFQNFSARFQGSAPHITLERGDEKVVLVADSLSGNLSRQGGTFDLTLQQLKLSYPHGDLSGFLHVDGTQPLVQLQLDGVQTDAAAVRKVAVTVWPNERVVNKIFEIVREGTVPHIRFTAQGAEFRDLKKSENFQIHGRMEQGRVYVPNVELDIRNVYGDVVISNGVLEGTNLSGKVGDSPGWDGGLIVGLVRKGGSELPFFLDITIEADLSDLPPILRRVVKSDLFLRELELVRNPRGRALGRLVLGDTLKSVQTRVVVENFELSGEYRRFPHPIETRGGTFFYEGTTAAVFGLQAVLGRSKIEEASVLFNSRPSPHLDVRSVRGAVAVEEVFPWLQSFKPVRTATRDLGSAHGTLLVESGNWKGTLLHRENRLYHFQGRTENLLVKSPRLPDSLVLKKGRFEVVPDRVTLHQWELACSDALVRVSGRVAGDFTGPARLDVTLDGSLGEKTVQWVHQALQVPGVLLPRPPVRLSQLRWLRETPDSQTFTGTLASNGCEVQLDLVREPRTFTVRRCAVRDSESAATLSFKREEQRSSFSFAGHLTGNTLNGLLLQNPPLSGEVRGDFKADIHWDQPGRSTASGSLFVKGLNASRTPDSPVIIHSMAMEGTRQGLALGSGSFRWRGQEMTMSGTVDFQSDAYLLNLDAAADAIQWQALREAEKTPESASGGEPQGKSTSVPLKGVIRIRASSLSYEKYTWSPFGAEVTLLPDGYDIALTHSVLCGIPTPGNIRFGRDGLQVDLKPAAKGAALESSLACLWEKDRLITGSFGLRGEIKGQGGGRALTESLEGVLSFNANEGRIYRLEILSKILALLNVTEIFRGRMPDLFREGFAYDSIHAKAHFDHGKLLLDESVIDGSSMKIVSRGEVDLVRKKLDLSVLVAPLKTADNLLQYMPLLNHMFEGGLISIPFQVTGDLSNPDVRPMPASGTGAELMNLMKRTLRAPLKVIEPFLPQTKEGAEPS